MALTYGAGLTAALTHVGVPLNDWMDNAQGRQGWADQKNSRKNNNAAPACAT